MTDFDRFKLMRAKQAVSFDSLYFSLKKICYFF